MNDSPPVRRRRLHYIGGFDPRGPAHYHRLCRAEAARPQPLGATLQVGERVGLSGHDSHWRVRWSGLHEGRPAQVETDHVFMGWHDRIRARWIRGPLALARAWLRTVADLLWRVGPLRLRALSPTALRTGLLVLAGPVIGTLPAWGARRHLCWLLRIVHFVATLGRGPLPDLQQRAAEWTETVIALQQADPVDEVLLVAHSVGTLVMVEAVDRLLADPRWQALQGTRCTHLLTLGQCLPLVGLMPDATVLRQALERLCSHPALRWWDVTARIDPLCLHATHPLAGSGVPTAGLPQPVPHHPRFFRMYGPLRWRQIRRDPLQAHFLYLMTPELAGNFQPLDVLYGPRSLDQHIARRGAP